ncbi:MAG: helix-turn-helix domain-containing protein [Brachymonas sp.]|nr:helix-turn-helix domain-containing protein [Brachymonas sp.]
MDVDSRSPSSEAQEALALSAAPASPGASSAGALLQAYREEAGMEQETLAAALKVSPQKLQALESDDYSALPALYFARGLAANICRHLERDPAPVLALMPDEKPRIPAAEKTDTHARTPAMTPVSIDPGSSSGWLKWLVAAAVLLALAAAAVWLIPQLRARMAAPANASSAAGDAAAPAVLSTSVPAATLASAPASASPTPLTLQPATLQPATVGAAAASAAAGAADNTLLIQASGNTWVKVSTVKGKKVFEGNLKAGDEQTIAIAQYPVRVIIGKAENVQVLDRGQPFDLSSVATRGMARFELKP